jgi:hypothetical protein
MVPVILKACATWPWLVKIQHVGKFFGILVLGFVGPSQSWHLGLALRIGTPERDTVAVKQRTVVVNDRMQQGYRYVRVAPVGRNFDPDFRPELTPPEMLRLGVFGGKYLTDCRDEFPASWFARAKLSPERSDARVNFFGVAASQPLSVWRSKGWIHREDPRGWFQWYCRYYRGRRLGDEDARQIKRWAAIRRHVRQLQMNCEPGDLFCRKRQRQALLHWAYDSRKL